MVFTFAVSFALFCVFIFTIFIFPAEFWMKFKGFTVSLSLVNIHHILVLLTSVWACEATAKEQKELLDETFRVAIASDDSLLSEKVRKDLTKESLRETSNRNWKWFLQIFYFIHQLKEVKVKYSCGLFDFNWHLCFRVSRRSKELGKVSNLSLFPDDVGGCDVFLHFDSIWVRNSQERLGTFESMLC